LYPVKARWGLIHVTESCDNDSVNLITDLVTTRPTKDTEALPGIHDRLGRRRLLPAEHRARTRTGSAARCSPRISAQSSTWITPSSRSPIKIRLVWMPRFGSFLIRLQRVTVQVLAHFPCWHNGALPHAIWSSCHTAGIRGSVRMMLADDHGARDALCPGTESVPEPRFRRRRQTVPVVVVGVGAQDGAQVALVGIPSRSSRRTVSHGRGCTSPSDRVNTEMV
jgi:hypothetical protein